MNKELEDKLWEIIKYALNTIEYNGKDDEHWLVCLSLTRHGLRDLDKLMKEMKMEEE